MDASVTPSLTGDPPRVTAPAAREELPRDAASPGRWRRRVLGVALLVLAALPAVLGLTGMLLDRGEPYLPYGDHAILALNVDAVGQHEVLLGAYSRFGWYHPGPMATYLLAGVYYLLDDAPQALAVGALLVGGASTVGAVWLIRRRAGLLAALWALLVIVLSVHTLGDDFLRDSWNPHLPVLPLLAAALLCWTAVRGDAWALPLAVVPLSLALQSHIGYLPAVGAIGAVLAAGLLLRGVRRVRNRGRQNRALAEGRSRRPVRWLVASVAAAVVGVILWLPPIVEQMTGDPGNARLLLDYLRTNSPEASLSLGDAFRAVADEFGRLPASLVGAGVADEPFLPQRWPPPAIAVGLALFLVAVADGVRRRRGDVVWLGVMTLAVGAAGVAAVARIEGLPFDYLTRWTVVVGILAWTTVGVSLLPELVAGVRRVVGRARSATWPDVLVGTPLAVLATVAVLVAGIGTAEADTPSTDVTGDLSGLEKAVVADLDQRGLRDPADQPVVRVEFARTSRPDELLGTLWPGAGLVLGLVRDGVDVQVSEFWTMPFGERYTERWADAGYVVTLAYADGTSPPPEPWQRVLATGDELQVYGGVPPTG
jgi:hypothetical protein